jgi:hypothetical protein
MFDEIGESEKSLCDVTPFTRFDNQLYDAFADHFASAPPNAGCVDDQVHRYGFDWRLREATNLVGLNDNKARALIVQDEARKSSLQTSPGRGDFALGALAVCVTPTS